MRPYDFTERGPGVYRFEIEAKGNSYTKQLLFPDDSKVTIRKLPFELVGLEESNKFKLTVEDPNNKNVEVKVEIFDENNDLVFRERVKKPDGFSKVYDLKDLNSSGFYFHICKCPGENGGQCILELTSFVPDG